jgi:hypothetical protein
MLHPRLIDFLTEARRIGIADSIVLVTNRVLLHKAGRSRSARAGV